ncbi:MAG: hypothetical protein LQ346_007648 [Caloplaca aetnensis]|nr:MAG: hypothetical protein LQ346_007648 [Caloplaca aetnensis]
MHFATLLTVLTILSTTLAAPVQTIEERHILTKTHIVPRQGQNIPQLLQLASLAGVTLPTNPTVLLSLGPVAASLQSYLPTSSVLSVLVTAAPSSFLSNVVHDPAYAASFEEAFAKGSSPSWFLALPTDVKSYLHTYSGYGDVATAVGDFGSVAAGETSESGSTATMTGSETSQTMSGMSSSTGSEVTTPSGDSASAQGTSPSGAAATAGAVGLSAILGLGLAGTAAMLTITVLL